MCHHHYRYANNNIELQIDRAMLQFNLLASDHIKNTLHICIIHLPLKRSYWQFSNKLKTIIFREEDKKNEMN